MFIIFVFYEIVLLVIYVFLVYLYLKLIFRKKIIFFCCDRGVFLGSYFRFSRYYFWCCRFWGLEERIVDRWWFY